VCTQSSKEEEVEAKAEEEDRRLFKGRRMASDSFKRIDEACRENLITSITSEVLVKQKTSAHRKHHFEALAHQNKCQIFARNCLCERDFDSNI
jgi:hypothetical protein